MSHNTLWSLLISQSGVLSRGQALELGLSPSQIERRIRSGEWLTVHPTVYRHAAHPPVPENAMRAAALWLGEQAVLTGLGAAWWWGHTDRLPPVWEFSTTCRTHLVAQSGVKVCRTFVDPFDRTRRRGVGVIGSALALLRGAVRLEQLDRGQGSAMLDRAKQRRQVTVPDLDRAFRRNKGTWGTVAMRELLQQTSDDAASELERRGIRLLRAAGITGFRVNYRLRLSNGRPVEFDIAFPGRKVAIELDGFAFHSDPAQMQADLARQRDVMDDGWTVRRFTWSDVVNDPDGFVRAVLALIS